MDVLGQVRSHNKENQGQEKEVQRLRVQLNDRLFELHKLEEDHAQQKAQIYIQLQKEKYQHAKTVKELRDKIKEDNEHWANKIQEIRAEKENDTHSLTQQIEHKLNTHFETQLLEVQTQHQREIAQLQTRIASQTQEYRKREEQLIKQYKLNAENTAKTHKSQQQQREKQHKKCLSELKKEYSLNMNQMQNMYIHEELHRKRIESELQTTIASHIKEKIAWVHTQNTLNQFIRTLNERTSQLEHTLLALNKQKEQLKSSHQSIVESITTQLHSQIKQMKSQYQQIIKQNLDRYLAEIGKMKDEIGSLIAIHRSKEESWQQCGRKVLQLYQKRESKKEDVKAIQKLQVQLIKKDFLIERQRKQLQHCKLQLQNMEDVYDRIFVFNSIRPNKNRSYHIKKMKNSLQVDQSNRSTITDKRQGAQYA